MTISSAFDDFTLAQIIKRLALIGLVCVTYPVCVAVAARTRNEKDSADYRNATAFAVIIGILSVVLVWGAKTRRINFLGGTAKDLLSGVMIEPVGKFHIRDKRTNGIQGRFVPHPTNDKIALDLLNGGDQVERYGLAKDYGFEVDIVKVGQTHTTKGFMDLDDIKGPVGGYQMKDLTLKDKPFPRFVEYPNQPDYALDKLTESKVARYEEKEGIHYKFDKVKLANLPDAINPLETAKVDVANKGDDAEIRIDGKLFDTIKDRYSQVSNVKKLDRLKNQMIPTVEPAGKFHMKDETGKLVGRYVPKGSRALDLLTDKIVDKTCTTEDGQNIKVDKTQMSQLDFQIDKIEDVKKPVDDYFMIDLTKNGSGAPIPRYVEMKDDPNSVYDLLTEKPVERMLSGSGNTKVDMLQLASLGISRGDASKATYKPHGANLLNLEIDGKVLKTGLPRYTTDVNAPPNKVKDWLSGNYVDRVDGKTNLDRLEISQLSTPIPEVDTTVKEVVMEWNDPDHVIGRFNAGINKPPPMRFDFAPGSFDNVIDKASAGERIISRWQDIKDGWEIDAMSGYIRNKTNPAIDPARVKPIYDTYGIAADKAKQAYDQVEEFVKNHQSKVNKFSNVVGLDWDSDYQQMQPDIKHVKFSRRASSRNNQYLDDWITHAYGKEATNSRVALSQKEGVLPLRFQAKDDQTAYDTIFKEDVDRWIDIGNNTLVDRVTLQRRRR
jgi:hypothetical protein